MWNKQQNQLFTSSQKNICKFIEACFIVWHSKQFFKVGGCTPTLTKFVSIGDMCNSEHLVQWPHSPSLLCLPHFVFFTALAAHCPVGMLISGVYCEWVDLIAFQNDLNISSCLTCDVVWNSLLYVYNERDQYIWLAAVRDFVYTHLTRAIA